MKRQIELVAVIAVAAVLMACDSPFKSDGGGESTPAEDDAVIATYTQTVNQSSQDTTVAPDVRVDGNYNNVTIIYGDRNSPTVNPAPAAEPEPEPEAEPEA